MPGLDTGWLSHTCPAGRGVMFPQPWLADHGGHDQRMDDVVGYGWTLVITDPAVRSPAAPGGVAVVRIGEDEQRERDGVVDLWMKRHGCVAALVRPDHYVFGGAASSTELDKLMGEWQRAEQ